MHRSSESIAALAAALAKAQTELTNPEKSLTGFTRTMPRVPAQVRGTYAGMGHPAAVAHLQRLGVTAVELLPVHAISDEAHLARAGRFAGASAPLLMYGFICSRPRPDFPALDRRPPGGL